MLCAVLYCWHRLGARLPFCRCRMPVACGCGRRWRRQAAAAATERGGWRVEAPVICNHSPPADRIDMGCPVVGLSMYGMPRYPVPTLSASSSQHQQRHSTDCNQDPGRGMELAVPACRGQLPAPDGTMAGLKTTSFANSSFSTQFKIFELCQISSSPQHGSTLRQACPRQRAAPAGRLRDG